jgi:hypothetical protein
MFTTFTPYSFIYLALNHFLMYNMFITNWHVNAWMRILTMPPSDTGAMEIASIEDA